MGASQWSKYGNIPADWAVEEEAIGVQLFHLFKGERRQRHTAESHQDGPFVGRQGKG